MKKLLLLSSLLSVASLSYSMNKDNANNQGKERNATRIARGYIKQVLGVQDEDQDFNNLSQVIDSIDSIEQDLKKSDLTDQDLNALLDRSIRVNAQAKELDQKEGLKKHDTSKTRKDYTQFIASLDKTREERSKKVSGAEVVLLKEQIEPVGIYASFRDMKIIEMVLGVRTEKREAQKKLYTKFSGYLGSSFSHQLNELQESLNKVNKCLKDNPENAMIINQKQLVKKEIKSFSDLKNYDSFYRSSMKRSKFDLFKQCQAAVKTARE